MDSIVIICKSIEKNAAVLDTFMQAGVLDTFMQAGSEHDDVEHTWVAVSVGSTRDARPCSVSSIVFGSGTYCP